MTFFVLDDGLKALKKLFLLTFINCIHCIHDSLLPTYHCFTRQTQPSHLIFLNQRNTLQNTLHSFYALYILHFTPFFSQIKSNFFVSILVVLITKEHESRSMQQRMRKMGDKNITQHKPTRRVVYNLIRNPTVCW